MSFWPLSCAHSADLGGGGKPTKAKQSLKDRFSKLASEIGFRPSHRLFQDIDAVYTVAKGPCLWHA
jgi:hypothetical protein